MDKDYNYIPLLSPLPVTDQTWPEGTLPLVSTTTNTFNHEDYIENCIRGFLMQKTTFPVQIIIFDDASTDQTRSIIKKYEAQYPHLITGFYPEKNTYKKPDRKLAILPRNKLRDQAKYVAVCEGDDYWTDPLKLQKQVEFMENHPDYSLCFHNARRIFEDKDKESSIFAEFETKEYTGDDLLKNWVVPTASVLYRTKDRKPYIRDNDFLYGDIVLFLTMASRGRVWGMSDVMSVYRIHGQGALSSVPRAGERVLKHHLAIKRNFPQFKSTQNFNLCKQYIYLSRIELKQGKVFSFFKSACKALACKPSAFSALFFKIYLNRM